jgi:hypothetical protein
MSGEVIRCPAPSSAEGGHQPAGRPLRPRAITLLLGGLWCFGSWPP